MQDVSASVSTKSNIQQNINLIKSFKPVQVSVFVILSLNSGQPTR